MPAVENGTLPPVFPVQNLYGGTAGELGNHDSSRSVYRSCPNFLLTSAAAIGPAREKFTGVARETVVVSVLVPGIGTCRRLVCLRGTDFHGRSPRCPHVKRGLEPNVCSLPTRIADSVVVHDDQTAICLVHRHPRIELIVERRLVVQHRCRTPSRSAVARPREPDARLAGRVDVVIRLVFGGIARRDTRDAGQIGPDRVDHVLRGSAIRTAGEVDQRPPARVGRYADVERVERRRYPYGRTEDYAAVCRFGDEEPPAHRIGPKGENVARTVRLDVAADSSAGGLGAAYLQWCLPRPRRSGAAIDEHRVVVVPNDVDVVLVGRGRAVIHPHHLLVGGRLRSRYGRIKRPLGAVVG